MSASDTSFYIHGRAKVTLRDEPVTVVQTLRIRHADVIRVKGVREVKISLLEPAEGDVMMFGTADGNLEIATFAASVSAPKETPLGTSSPRMRITSAEPCDLYIAIVPRFELALVGIGETQLGHGVTQLPKNSALLLPFVRALDIIFDRSDQARIDVDSWSDDLLHLMGRGILNAPKRRFDHRESPLVARARAIIYENFHDPETNPALVAKLLGVPLRTLQRRFAEESSSVSDEIRHMRVQAAKEILEAGGGDSVAFAAREAGFGSVASLRRALKE